MCVSPCPASAVTQPGLVINEKLHRLSIYLLLIQMCPMGEGQFAVQCVFRRQRKWMKVTFCVRFMLGRKERKGIVTKYA